MILERIFYKIYLGLREKKVSFIICLLLVFSAMIYFILPLNLEEDISKLVPQTEESRELNKILKQADFSDKIVVHISRLNKSNSDELTSYALEMLDSINLVCKPLFSELVGEIVDDDVQDTRDFIASNTPLFLDEKDYEQLTNRIHSDSIEKRIAQHYRMLTSPSGMVAKDLIRKDPFGLTFPVYAKLEDLKFESGLELNSGFLTTTDNTSLLLFISPALATNETEKNTVFVNLLERIQLNLNKKYQGAVQSEYFGSTIIAVSNASQIKTDIKYTIGWAMLLLLVILILFYRKLWVPILLFVPSLLGGLTALIVLQMIRPSISAVSLGLGSVLLGITLDYSLHILTHLRKNRNVYLLYSEVTKPILMSSVTTAVAFLCLVLLKSQALQDLGLFAAISVISASVFALILIPMSSRQGKNQSGLRKTLLERFSMYSFDRNKILTAAVGAMFLMSFFTYDKVLFNKDLDSMNYQSEEVLLAKQHLDSILNLSSKSVYIVTYGEDLQDVLEKNNSIYSRLKKLRDDQVVKHFASNGGIVYSDATQVKRIKVWNEFWTDSLKARVKEDLVETGRNFGFKSNTYDPFYEMLEKNPGRVSLEDYSKIKAFMTKDFIQTGDDLVMAVNLVKIHEQGKSALISALEGIQNTLIIDRKEINETFLGNLKDDFSSLVKYSMIAVILILFLFFRNLELTLITAAPIFITWFLTLGIMGLFGIEFTIFNVIISTFIFGLGVDYSIFISSALMKDYAYGSAKIGVYKTSIVLSVITTILGVGVLILAKHPALRSIAKISLIGINMTWLVVFIVQPLLFRIFISNRARKGFAPIKIRQLLFSIFLTVYYSIAGMILSLLSMVLMPLIPISKKKKFKVLHKLSATLVRTVLYLNPFVSKKVINETGETFEKPAIIISNHASALDTLTYGLLTHNLIYMVNDWVYKSPVFGILARVMGYYPVSSGVEGSYDHLKEKVKQGYSLVIFPEGKRSLTNRVGRFHKGAFYLQDNLGLDILPVYLHGNAEVMPKNDFIIHDGRISVVVGERIPVDDQRFGSDYRSRNKEISKFYKANFFEIRKNLEPADYFKDVLLSNYFAKPSYLMKEIKSDFDQNKHKYNNLNNILPEKVKLLHWASDFGQVDILLTSKSLNRKILSIYEDEQRKVVAENCYVIKSRKVKIISEVNQIKDETIELLLIDGDIEKNKMDSLMAGNFSFLLFFSEFQYLEHCFNLGYELNSQNEDFLLLKNNSF